MSSTCYALAIGAHPDDVELSCGATLRKITDEGYKVVVCDLTRGELGSRGTPEERLVEARNAARINGYAERITLDYGDGQINYSREIMLKIVSIIRHYKPHVVFTTPPDERHPDHEFTSRLVKDACFFAGLKNIQTTWKEQPQKPHRPKELFFFMQNHMEHPKFIVDVSSTFEQAKSAILAFKSQFYNPESGEEETYISRKEFLTGLEARARYFGELIGADYGEAFTSKTQVGIRNFTGVFKQE